jgi:regulator of protease activity HflC (stomatin/prohibitin superfamily)
VKEWGVTVTAVEITDIKITDSSIEQAIALKAKAQKEADAELERALRQPEISKHLNAAAQILTADGWRLKGFEVLVEMTRSAENNTILIPTEITSMLADNLPDKVGPLLTTALPAALPPPSEKAQAATRGATNGK